MRDLLHLDCKKSANRVALLNWTTIMVILTISYLENAIVGLHTWWFFILFLILGFIPLGIGYAVYVKDQQNPKLKYIIGIAYTVLYTYLLFSSDPMKTYIFIFPMLVNVLVFSDKKSLLLFGVLNTILNIANIVYNLVILKNPDIEGSEYAVQFFAVLLVMGIAFFVTTVQEKINKHQLLVVEEEQGKTSQLLKEVVQSTNAIGAQIVSLNKEASHIAEEAEGANRAVIEINSGTGDMVNNIQEQMEVSTHITSLLDLATNSSREIQHRFAQTRDNTAAGMQNMMELDKASRETRASNETVDHTMQLLNEKTQEVRSIIEIINGITKQTHLLSLNAAIEAARAGDSGRGFAVVADEISKLAADTQGATENINKILAELSAEAENATNAVASLNTANIHQNEIIEETKAKFTVIQADISDMNTNISQQTDSMEEIHKLNAKIAQTIEFLSAFSEELMANTESTKEMMEQTKVGCSTVSDVLIKITGEVDALSEVTKANH